MINAFNLWFSRQSLVQKLSWSILSCVFLGFLGFVSFISEHSEHIIKSQLDSLAQKNVQNYVAEISGLAADTEKIVLNTRNSLNQISENDVDSIKLLLTSALKSSTSSSFNFNDAWIYFFAEDKVAEGTLYVSKYHDYSIGFSAEKIDNFYAHFPWFKEVPKEEKIYWSEPYIDQETGRTVITCLLPFMFKNSTILNGLAAISVDLTNIQDNISKFSFNEKGKLLLISRSGLYVTYPDPGIALHTTIFELAEQLNLPKLSALGKDVLSGHSGMMNIAVDVKDFNGNAVFFYAPIPQLKWGIFLIYSAEQFFFPLHKFRSAIMLALLSGLLILFSIISWICHYSTRPLLQLSKIAEHYGQGNFLEDFPEIKSADEIGILSRTLSNMRTNLLDYIEKEKNAASEKQRSQSELEIAKQIQKSALSVDYPQHKAFQICSFMEPARQVGGDFYDFFFVGKNKFAIVIADVSGKGIPAALFMMKTQALIKSIAKQEKSASEVFYKVNNELYIGNDTCMFVSAFMAVIDLERGIMEYVNAGHTPPFLDSGNGYKIMSPDKNVLLGIYKDARFTSGSLQLQSGNRVFLYTDGVTEAENVKTHFYGENRLSKILLQKSTTPSETISLVIKDIKKFVKNNEQSDDITMLEFLYTGNSANGLTVEANNLCLPEVLNYIRKDMSAENIATEKQNNMIVAAEEIFSNIAQYAYKDNGKVDIITAIENGYYTITFKDSGKHYNPLKHKDMDLSLPPEERPIGGLGIILIKKMTDLQSYSYANQQNIFKVGIKI